MAGLVLDGGQQPLGLLHRLRAVAAQPHSQGPALREQLIRRAEPVRHVEAAGGDGIEGLGTQHVTAGLTHSHGAYHIGADHRRYQPQAHLGEAEAGVVAGQYDVTGTEQTEGPAIGRPLHQRHSGEGELVQGLHQPGQYPGIFPVLFKRGGIEVALKLVAHPVEVGASAKVPTLCPQQQDMGAFCQRLAVAMGQIIEAIEQLLHQIGVEGVVAGGACQHQLNQRTVALQPTACQGVIVQWVGHVELLTSGRCRIARARDWLPGKRPAPGPARCGSGQDRSRHRPRDGHWRSRGDPGIHTVR